MPVRDDILSEELTNEQQIEVEKVFDVFAKLSQEDRYPYQPANERLRKSRKSIDIHEIPSLLKEILDNKQTSEGIASEQLIVFTEEHPNVDITTEAITFSLVTREPGSISKGPAFNRGVQEWKPHIRGIEEDQQLPGQRIVVMGQKFDNEFMLTCWARSNKQANIRARWLEDVLRQYTWFLKFSGVEEFYFLGQGSDIALELSPNVRLMGRPLRFFVRTESITNLKEQTIRKIIIQYGIGHELLQIGNAD